MLEPSIDKLQEKIDSKYSLVTISAQRARTLQDEGKPLVKDTAAQTFVGIALQEIKEGKVYVKDSSE